MESTPLVVGRADESVGRFASGALPVRWRRMFAARANLQLMGMPRVNMMFIGADDVVWRALGNSLRLSAPIASWRPGEPLILPAADLGTLIIRDVGEMTDVDQARLLKWLDHAVGHTQVVCTSNSSLLPLMAEGRFSDSLYYRLNTICVDLDE